MRVADLPSADSLILRLADEVLRRYSGASLQNHALRTACWARGIGIADGLAFDLELVHVAALLHDIGLEEPFDSAGRPFEEASGEVAWVFTAGAGWPITRRGRLAEVIRRHMWHEVRVDADVEGHLLERATALDVTGSGREMLDAGFVAEVLDAWPPLRMSTEFVACMEDQGRRKPESAAARSVVNGLRTQADANPLLYATVPRLRDDERVH